MSSGPSSSARDEGAPAAYNPSQNEMTAALGLALWWAEHPDGPPDLRRDQLAACRKTYIDAEFGLTVNGE